MRPQTMAAAFESCETALTNCHKSGNEEWAVRWKRRLHKLVELIPSGSGIDRAPRTRDDVEVSSSAIRFDVGYHHMDDVGHYDGWTDHTVTIRPAFDGVNVQVSGRDRRDVKDNIREVMWNAFTRHVTWDEPMQRWLVESDDDRYAAMERAYPRAEETTREHEREAYKSSDASGAAEAYDAFQDDAAEVK